MERKSSAPADDPILYRPADLARKLGLGRSTVYELLAQGELESVHVGRSRRIPAASVNEWLRRRLDANRPTS